MRRFTRRNPPSGCALCPLKAAVGGLLTLAAMVLMADMTGNMLAVAPLAATSVMVFAAPASPMAQPANVIGGHVLSTTVALLLDAALPDTWWAVAAGVAVVILAMELARVTHPPAGADALVVMTSHVGLSYLLFPILIGSICVVAAAVALHRWLPPRGTYPLPQAD